MGKQGGTGPQNTNWGPKKKKKVDRRKNFIHLVGCSATEGFGLGGEEAPKN